MLQIKGSTLQRTEAATAKPSDQSISSVSSKYTLVATNDASVHRRPCIDDCVTTSLADAMENIHALKTLQIAPPVRLPSSCLGNHGAAQIAKILKHPENQLEELSLWQNFIGCDGANDLSGALLTNGRLTHLDLSWNPEIGDAGCGMIATALTSEHCMLTKLGLAGCNLSDVGVASIVGTLVVSFEEASASPESSGQPSPKTSPRSSGTSLEELSLYANCITPVGAAKIAEALTSDHCLLRRLDLRVNQIGNQGVKSIMQALRHANHSRLTYLDLESNGLGDEAAKAICAALRSGNCQLERLHLTNNNISDPGMKKLCVGLSCHTSRLKYLDLNKNSIGHSGVFELSTALSSEDCCLEHVFIYSNPFASTEEGEIEAAVALFGAVSKRVPTVLVDFGGVALYKGTTAIRYQDLVNKDLLSALRKNKGRNQEEDENEVKGGEKEKK